MATEPEGNLGKRRFGPSDRLKAMFRSALRSCIYTVAIVFALNLRTMTLSVQVLYGRSHSRSKNNRP